MPRGKPFEPGNTLGRGRPKGSKNKSKNVGLELIQSNEAAIWSKLLGDFFRGDKTAKYILFKFLSTNSRPRLKLGPTKTIPQINDALGRATKAAADGTITTQAGVDFAHMLETKRKLNESDDLEVRLSAVEKRLAESKRASEPHGVNLPEAPSGLRHTDCTLTRALRARFTFSRMSEADAVQMKGLGRWL